MNFGTLAARALNNAWVTHKPSYAGLRLLLANVTDDGAVLETLLDRRVKRRTRWRYYGFPIYKDAGRDGAPDYRNCIVGSPLTLLAESNVLSQMADEAAFSVSDCVYSNRWPISSNCGRNFEYYINGYHERNERIRALLSTNRDAVALVFDIKRFYPSIDVSILKAALENRLSKISSPSKRDSIETFVFGMLDLESPITSHGIPIGPDLSHVLGNIALAKVDSRMSERFEGRYFRYVDDMIIVCSARDADEVSAFLGQLLGEEGLCLNEGKTDVVSSEYWVQYCPSVRDRVSDSLFDTLTSRIVRFFIESPGDIDSLLHEFDSNGFSLPLGRMRALSNSTRYHSFLGLKTLYSWALTKLTGPSDTVADLIALAHRARAFYQLELQRELEMAKFNTSTRHRWQIQKWRLLTSRLMCLLSAHSYPSLLLSVPSYPELAEIRSVLSAIITGNCTSILNMPGRAISTFSQFWQITKRPAPLANWASIKFDRAVASAACDLSLMLGVSIPSSASSDLLPNFPGTSLLLKICGNDVEYSAPPRSQAYLDEMLLLFKGHKSNDYRNIFSTRYDEREDVGFEVMRLGVDFSGFGGASGPYS